MDTVQTKSPHEYSKDDTSRLAHPSLAAHLERPPCGFALEFYALRQRPLPPHHLRQHVHVHVPTRAVKKFDLMGLSTHVDIAGSPRGKPRARRLRSCASLAEKASQRTLLHSNQEMGSAMMSNAVADKERTPRPPGSDRERDAGGRGAHSQVGSRVLCVTCEVKCECQLRVRRCHLNV